VSLVHDLERTSAALFGDEYITTRCPVRDSLYSGEQFVVISARQVTRSLAVLDAYLWESCEHDDHYPSNKIRDQTGGHKIALLAA
jgi:hypothetical protein